MIGQKSIAIIGSGGMLGSDLFHYLRYYFKKIIGINRKNYDQYRGHQFDIIINADGNSNKYWANKNILADFVASTDSVYATLFDFPCKKYVYISSSDVYEDHTGIKTTKESNIIDTVNLTPYGFHKYLSECIIKNFIKNYIILRCSMILGTNLKKGPVYDILHKSRLFITQKSRFQVITTIALADILNFLLAQNTTEQVFNVGGRGAVLFSRITKYIQQSVNFSKNGKTQVYETDVSKLHEIYRLKTSVEYMQDFLKSVSR